MPITKERYGNHDNTTNDPKADNFRTGESATIINWMLSISLCANTWLFRSEINSYRGSSFTNFCSYLWNISSQNLVDLVAIIFAYAYIVLRFLMPSQSFLSEEDMHEDDQFENLFLAMPILHTVMLLLLYG